jgi:hypothetical protein
MPSGVIAADRRNQAAANPAQIYAIFGSRYSKSLGAVSASRTTLAPMAARKGAALAHGRSRGQ